MIDDVQNRVGPPGFHAIADRGQVGGGVEKRPVLLAHDHRRVVAVEEDADRPVAFPGDAFGEQFVDDRRQPILVKTLAQGVVEVTSSRLYIRLISSSQAGRNSSHKRRFSASPACSLAVSASTAALMSGCWAESRAISDPSFAAGGMLFLIVHHLPDQPIQPGEFLDRILPIGFGVEKMFVAVEDHAELRAPVADVVVADDLVAEESQRAAKRVADHRRADVADVHRLGHVRGGKVDHVSARAGRPAECPTADRPPPRSAAGRASRLSAED